MAKLLPKFCTVALLFVASSCAGHGVSTLPSSPSNLHSRPHPHLHQLTTTGAYTSAVLADLPTAYYRLDDTGTTAADSSGHSLNGTIGSLVTKNVPGLLLTDSDTAMSFPGTASAAGVVTVPQTTQLQPASVVSFEAWIRFTTVPTLYTFVTGYGSDSAESPYGFYFRSGGLLDAQFALTGGNVDLKDPNPLAPNTTYYVAETFDGTTARMYVNGVQVASGSGSGTFKDYQPGYGLSIGADAGFSDPAFKGTVDEVAVYAGAALTAARIAAHYSAGTNGSTPPPTPTPPPTGSYVDWNTFGGGLQRLGYNPSETTLSTTTVANGLNLLWSTDLGGAITAQPVLATNVTVAGASHNVLYVGAENNVFYAVDADTGAILWSNTTFGGPLHGPCSDLPGGQFGITGTATYDKTSGQVWVTDANGKVHALSMTTGKELWHSNLLMDPNTGVFVGTPAQDHAYSALAYNPSNGMLYASTGSFCEVAPWHGRVIAINTSTHRVLDAFFPARTGLGKTGTVYCGAGIWGMGGAAIDPATNDVYVASGNVVATAQGGCLADASGETYPYGNAVLQLDPQLNLISFQTATYNGMPVTGDSDYGGSPMLYAPSDCTSNEVSTKNKDGLIYTYGVGSTLTPVQQLQVGNKSEDGQFIGVPAYDPTVGLVYVGNPNAKGTYAHGIDAFAQSGGCTGLTLAWKASVGTANAVANDNEAPTVANGVVYFTDGLDDQLWAFNDKTGAVLWHSGTTIAAPCASYGGACGVYGAPLVDQHVYVGSFNHKLYAFGVSGGSSVRKAGRIRRRQPPRSR